MTDFWKKYMSPEEQQKAIQQMRASLGDHLVTKVLLVEDDTRDAQIFLSVLGDFGIKATWVHSVEDALSVLRSSEIYVVILDLKVLGGESLEVLDYVKSSRPDCKVIVLTGAYTPDTSECKEALRRGAVAVMMKPLTKDQVELIFGTP